MPYIDRFIANFDIPFLGLFVNDSNLYCMSAVYNPIIQQNATWQIQLTLTAPGGSPFNLTNYTGKSSIKASYKSTTILAAPTVVIVSPTAGTLTVSLSAELTSLLAPTCQIPNKTPLPVWDVLISNSDQSEIIQILEGSVTVNPGVTVWT